MLCSLIQYNWHYEENSFVLSQIRISREKIVMCGSVDIKFDWICITVSMSRIKLYPTNDLRERFSCTLSMSKKDCQGKTDLCLSEIWELRYTVRSFLYSDYLFEFNFQELPIKPCFRWWTFSKHNASFNFLCCLPLQTFSTPSRDGGLMMIVLSFSLGRLSLVKRNYLLSFLLNLV